MISAGYSRECAGRQAGSPEGTAAVAAGLFCRERAMTGIGI